MAKALCARVTVAVLILCAAWFLVGCSQTNGGDSSSGTSQTNGADSSSGTSQSAQAPTPSATQLPTPNPDEAAGLVTRFYRDIDSDTKSSVTDLGTIVSADFMRNHHEDWSAAYGFIREPKVQVRDVSARTVKYTIDYVYLTSQNGKLFWERSGHWTLNHGAHSGWVLDDDVWNSLHLVGLLAPNSSQMTSVQDKVYGDGRHEFTYQGQMLSFLAKGDSWHITVVATPTPAASSAWDAAISNGATSGNNSPYQAPPPPPVSTDCEEVGVEGVYDDGAIIALDDGRHLRVAGYDQSIAETWVAPFDGLICNGDRFIDKDDNEAVDLGY